MYFYWYKTRSTFKELIAYSTPVKFEFITMFIFDDLNEYL